MSRYEWDAPITGSERAAGAVVAAQAADGATITLHLESRDYELHSAFVVTDERGRAIASTDDAAQWATVERYVPRSEWPVGMAGRNDNATPDPAVLDAIAAYATDYLAGFVDDFGQDEDDRPDDYDEIVGYWWGLARGYVAPMTAAEFRVVTEWLGLGQRDAARVLEVNERTVRAWTSGRYPVPDGVREQIERIEAYTAGAVGDVVAALNDMRDPAVHVFATNADMWAQRPELEPYPASWWRMVVARAVTEVPGVVIDYHQQN